MPKEDSELVTAALEGDSGAFEEIIRRYQRLVFNIVFHYLGSRDIVEDLAQEVFLKLYRSLDSYDGSRPLKPWVSRITVNTCLDELRKRKTRKMTLFADLTTEEEGRIDSFYERSVQDDSLTVTDAEESFRIIQKVLNELPEKDRLAFVLREVEGLPYSEVALSMNTSELGARIRVSRARKKMQHKLQKVLFLRK